MLLNGDIGDIKISITCFPFFLEGVKEVKLKWLCSFTHITLNVNGLQAS